VEGGKTRAFKQGLSARASLCHREMAIALFSAGFQTRNGRAKGNAMKRMEPTPGGKQFHKNFFWIYGGLESMGALAR